MLRDAKFSTNSSLGIPLVGAENFIPVKLLSLLLAACHKTI